jgi:hypothetical protein
MTHHPITPSPELVSKWCYEDGEEIKSSPRWFFSVCAKAAQWGADQELEACCEWVSQWAPRWPDGTRTEDELRAARRPKPPSLKEQALEQLDGIRTVFRVSHGGDLVCDIILRALEQLDD